MRSRPSLPACRRRRGGVQAQRGGPGCLPPGPSPAARLCLPAARRLQSGGVGGEAALPPALPGLQDTLLGMRGRDGMRGRPPILGLKSGRWAALLRLGCGVLDVGCGATRRVQGGGLGGGLPGLRDTLLGMWAGMGCGAGCWHLTGEGGVVGLPCPLLGCGVLRHGMWGRLLDLASRLGGSPRKGSGRAAWRGVDGIWLSLQPSACHCFALTKAFGRLEAAVRRPGSTFQCQRSQPSALAFSPPPPCSPSTH